MNEGAWSPLSDTDPVPGDPWKVNELGTHLLEQAEKIGEMVAALKQVHADEIKSVAIDSIMDKRDEVSPDLMLLAKRYLDSGQALRDYGGVLDQAQEMANKARTDSWDAQRRIDEAQQALTAADATTKFTPTGTLDVPALFPVLKHDDDLRLAKADLEKAELLLFDATALRDRAVGNACHILDEANHDDLKNPSRGFLSPFSGMVDSVKNLPKNIVTLASAVSAAQLAFAENPFAAIGKAAVGITKWTVESFTSLENFSSHLGLIGAAIGIATIFFPPTTLIATIGFAISATKLGLDTYMAANGKGSWGDVALGVVGMATFGAARIAATTSKARAMEDTLQKIKDLRGVEGLDAINQAKLLRAEKVVRILRNEEFSNRTLPTLTRWGNLIKDPGTPSKALLQFSPQAQKIHRVSQGVTMYDKIDGKIGKAGAIAAWADELKPPPTAKDFIP